MTTRMSKSKPEMEIQYGAVRFSKPEVVHLARGLRYFIKIWFGNRFPTPYTIYQEFVTSAKKIREF